MKKFIIFFSLVVATLNAFCQNSIPETNKQRPNRINFTDKPGSFIRKDRINYLTIGELFFETFTVTDLASNHTFIELDIKGSKGEKIVSTFNAALYADELVDFLKVYDYIATNVIKTDAAKNFVDFQYESRSGFRFGTCGKEYSPWTSKRKWTAYVQFDKYTDSSTFYIGFDALSKLKDMIVIAQSKNQVP
ncbi:hypothetical protein KHS38_09365 [Mucilaginibacter sp. Bleaf8]|uniref:hypothetical protein n=1 Tax=Mucilaginibacter sp. Bleaf8 TaxID=2834430 RepID=UPI001BD0BE30|nr:hypothetical protein [Mucilaginibacter sp. Bleaf8]MBS7564614.1 hypothetical protein [Mucilaginibacter sp. Bleaf8]